jgi:hypothetical protein
VGRERQGEEQRGKQIGTIPAEEQKGSNAEEQRGGARSIQGQRGRGQKAGFQKKNLRALDH